MTEKLKLLISNLKHLPGVYLMHDRDDNIIYVGKAKDLQKRVSQYFLRPQKGKVFKMVCNVDYFETIITKNEKEALILEMNLIQKYMPRYNILLKDDSHYPYIAIKKGNDPVLVIKHKKKEKDYTYYGPYPSSGSAREMVDLLNKLFPLRKCHHIPSTPCLYYHLGTCLAPCVNKIETSQYESLVNDIDSFLSGNNTKIKKQLEEKIKVCSDNLEYERANDYANMLKAIEHINIKQSVEGNKNLNIDVFGYSIRNDYLALTILIYRKGLLIGKNTHVVECFDEEAIQVSDLICQYYDTHELPHEVIINNEEIVNELNTLLDTKVSYISKGKILELVITAKENAVNALDEYFMSARLDDDKLKLLESLGELLNIPTPLHIELFDNSHLQGSNAVGAMVCYINGEPCKKLYRKFNITSNNTKDDLLSMKEVIYRHYSRSIKEGIKLPNLILVDGGLTQCKVAKQVIDELNLPIHVFGLYKGLNSGHSTTGIISASGQEYIIKDKSLFFLLTRMQDEVHRFAISFHVNKRSKNMTKSILDDISGLGNKRKESIFRAYQDINALKNASIEELSQIVPKEVATSLFNKLHNIS